MDLSALASLVSTPGRKLALGLSGLFLAVLACIGCYFYGRHDGSVTATALGEAKYSKLETSIATANRLASDTARRIVDAEIIRRDKAEKDLAAARQTIAARGRVITNRRIEDASLSVAPAAAGGCVFGPAWVRLWNEALGLGDGDPACAPAAPGSAGAAR